jgi:hypothetical protein
VSASRAGQWLRWSALWDKGGRDPRFLEDPDKYAAEMGWEAARDEARILEIENGCGAVDAPVRKRDQDE